MLPNVGYTEQLIVFLAKLGILPLEKLFTPYCLQVYANFTLWVRSITIEQIAADLPGLHG